MRRPPARLRRAVPDLPRQRPRPVRAQHPGADPGRGQGRPADPAAGKGAAGENGGPAGDLYVTVKVSPHRLFGRKGDNLTLDVPISFDEAALGAEIKIPTLGGSPVTLKVPAGTPNGRTFRVRGKGVAQEGRHQGRPARHRRGPGARRARRRARGRPSRPTGPPATSRPLRANLFERGRIMSDRQPFFGAPSPDAAVFVISVAAELTGLHPQTLRTYERMGLITARPHRRWRASLLAARHRAAPRDRRPDLVRHRHRGRTPHPRAREPGRRPRRRATRSCSPSSRPPARRCARPSRAAPVRRSPAHAPGCRAGRASSQSDQSDRRLAPRPVAADRQTHIRRRPRHEPVRRREVHHPQPRGDRGRPARRDHGGQHPDRAGPPARRAAARGRGHRRHAGQQGRRRPARAARPGRGRHDRAAPGHAAAPSSSPAPPRR